MGFSTLKNRISRVEQKLANGTFSQTLLRRYQFQQTYRDLINRKRLSLRPDIYDFAIADTLSFVASVEAAHGEMSEAQRDRLRGRDQRQALVTEFADWQSKGNHHCMVTANKKSVLFFSLYANRAPRPYNAICDSLKRAAKQFSTTRPAVIWGHFLGLSEEDMYELLERKQHNGIVLDVFGNYLFKTESRNHVCRLRLSADGTLLQGSSQKMVRGGGPAYDLRSSVSRFDTRLTNEDR